MSKTKKAVSWGGFLPTGMNIASSGNFTAWANKQAKKKPKKKPKTNKPKPVPEEYRLDISFWKKDMSPTNPEVPTELLTRFAEFFDEHPDHKWRINSQKRIEHNISAEERKEKLGLKMAQLHNEIATHYDDPQWIHLGGLIFFRKKKHNNLYEIRHSCGTRGGLYIVRVGDTVCSKCNVKLMSHKAMMTAIALKELKAATK